MKESSYRRLQLIPIAIPAILLLASIIAAFFFFSRIRFYADFKDSIEEREHSWSRFLWETQQLLVSESILEEIEGWNLFRTEYEGGVSDFLNSPTTLRVKELTPRIDDLVMRFENLHVYMQTSFDRVEDTLAEYHDEIEDDPDFEHRRISDLIMLEEVKTEYPNIWFLSYRIFYTVNNRIYLAAPAYHSLFNSLNDELEKQLNRFYRIQTTVIVLVVIFSVILNILVFYFRARQTRAELAVRRASEEAALKINQELEARVEERTSELRDALDEYSRINLQLTTTNNRLEEAMQTINTAKDVMVEQEKQAALGRLVAGLAHDVNTPLGVSLTAATFLKTKIDKLKDFTGVFPEDGTKRQTEMSESAALLIRNLQKTAEIVRYFRQLSLDQQGAPRRREFDLVEYLTVIAENLKTTIEENGCTLKLNLPDSFVVDSYPGAFSSAVTNLLTNAAQHGYESSGGGPVILELEVQETRLLLHCRDFGQGIQPEFQKTVFDPFFTTKRSVGASGLGLSIAYNYVTQVLKGELKCSSEPGKGSVFTIDVPVSPWKEVYRTP